MFTGELEVPAAAGQTDRRNQWPRELAGIRVEVDGTAAGLLFVSSRQINFVIPPETRLGAATLVVSHTELGILASGVMELAASAPALFSADGSGSGAGLIVNRWTDGRGPFSLTTLANPGCDKRTVVSALATGVTAEFARDLLDSNISSFVRVRFEGGSAGPIETDEVLYAGPEETLEGVDRVDFRLPPELASAGQTTIRLIVDGVESNAVVIELGPSEQPAGDCPADGFVVAYNTVADLLAGDLWDVTEPAAVFAAFEDVPDHWPLMGVGTTAEEGHNGEVIAFGTAGAPELLWSDPEFPPTVRILTTEAIPFAGVAAGNPDHAIIAEADPGRSIHAQVVELAEANNLAFAGIRVSGWFSGISYSVAHNLLKQGTPLTDPTVDKAPFQLFFDVPGQAQWELSGFYGASSRVQDIVSVRGAPVHLHGSQLDRSRAGHVGSAIAEGATIRLYPLQAPIVRDADLAIRLLSFDSHRVAFEVVNRGENAVTRTTVQGLVGDQVSFQFTLPVLAGEQSTSIEIANPPESLLIVVDPFNDLLESDEANNAVSTSNAKIESKTL